MLGDENVEKRLNCAVVRTVEPLKKILLGVLGKTFLLTEHLLGSGEFQGYEKVKKKCN